MTYTAQFWQYIIALKPGEISQMITALVALVAVFLGPFMQHKIAKRQVQMQAEIADRQSETQRQIATRQIADSIASRRQTWIDELRSEAAEFLTLFTRLEELRRPSHGLSEDDQRKNFEDMAVANSRASELGIRIKLRLNPKEKKHIDLTDLLRVLSDLCLDPPLNETQEQRKAAEKAFRTARDNVIIQFQSILKHEWERVKRGEI